MGVVTKRFVDLTAEEAAYAIKYQNADIERAIRDALNIIVNEFRTDVGTDWEALSPIEFVKKVRELGGQLEVRYNSLYITNADHLVHNQSYVNALSAKTEGIINALKAEEHGLICPKCSHEFGDVDAAIRNQVLNAIPTAPQPLPGNPTHSSGLVSAALGLINNAFGNSATFATIRSTLSSIAGGPVYAPAKEYEAILNELEALGITR